MVKNSFASLEILLLLNGLSRRWIPAIVEKNH
jgi:hypothetical protein